MVSELTREADLIDMELPSSNAEYLHFDWQDAKEVYEMEVGGCWGVDCGISGAPCLSSLELLPTKPVPVSQGVAILLPVVNA